MCLTLLKKNNIILFYDQYRKRKKNELVYFKTN